MARPLFFEFEGQSISDTVSDVYMWGSNLLIAPVFTPDAETRKAFLPAGDWYSFYSHEYFEGGQDVIVDVNDQTIPVFARGGSFIPLSAPVQSTDRYTGERIQVKCYLSNSTSSFSDVVYFDNGKQKDAYQKGEYEQLILACNSGSQGISISIKKEGNGYDSAPENRVVDLTIVGLKMTPTEVLINGAPLNFNWNNSLLQINDISVGEGITLEVK